MVVKLPANRNLRIVSLFLEMSWHFKATKRDEYSKRSYFVYKAFFNHMGISITDYELQEKKRICLQLLTDFTFKQM